LHEQRQRGKIEANPAKHLLDHRQRARAQIQGNPFSAWTTHQEPMVGCVDRDRPNL
jgi:hypothetical protein